MLARYQKKGGFVQLLGLIEGFGSDKRRKFIELIREENSNWANLIEIKMLSIEKICSWSPEILREIFSRLNPLTVSLALHGLDQENREKIFSVLGFTQSREIKEQFEMSKPSAIEISSVFMKIVSEVRGMEAQGLIRFEKIEPSLIVHEDIENQLEKNILSAVRTDSTIQTETSSNLKHPGSMTGTSTESVASLNNLSTIAKPALSANTQAPVSSNSSKSDLLTQVETNKIIHQNQTLARQLASAQEEIQLLRATIDQISKMAKIAIGFKKVG